MRHTGIERDRGRRLDEFLRGARNRLPLWWLLRYGAAAVAVAVTLGLRAAVTAWIGPGLPTYITFYPAVMVVALLAGFGPGLLTAALTMLVSAHWILPPEGLAVSDPVDRLSLGLFAGMGLFMSAVAELYRRNRLKAAGYDREEAVRESREALRESEERRKVAEAVQAERQRSYEILEKLPVMICLTTHDHHVPFANHCFREHFGESNGRRCFEYKFNQTEPCTECRGLSPIEPVAPRHCEKNTPDGSCYDVYVLPFTDVDGSPLILEMDVDITGRKRAEAELDKHRQQLEELVAARTAEYQAANDALRESREDLKRSNKDLEQFAYVASHDLQEPLRQVSGFVGLLERDYGPQFDRTANEYFNFVKDGASRMYSLINDLLDYSRVGRTGTTVPNLDLNKAVGNALMNLQTRIEETCAQITVDPLPTLRGNPLPLTQVFQNLIGNSLKFHGQDRPEIHIGARHEGAQWLFWVKDNGIGFAQQYAERIFLVFQRVHGRGQYEGTGIGLAICKRAIEQHGGRIWAESAPGHGATFYFTLPAN